MKTFVRVLLLVGAGLLGSGLAHAEGGCPPGMYPFQFAPNQPSSCAPIPGNGNQQAPQQLAPQWERRWGAITTDAPNAVIGVAVDRRSEGEASQAAIRDCQRQGGVNCKIDVTYDNQCAVLVVGSKTYNTPNAATIQKATELGMKTCRSEGNPDCRVLYSACSLPVLTR